MASCLITVQRDYRGCTLLYDGRPLTWYADTAQALALARLLAEARNLRDGTSTDVELLHPGGTREHVARYG
ncbi:hypothetical protein [Xanthomonas sp. XNM01]|uniref:hypothetical protein n=1 Tax=Xanthomonas sp. XNM01 TaxID=2769289 RepID=UPI00177D9BB2|nr:hypothetical protein [Xanthomonas sp. XNM01]MBD9367873.1 hypothetical protein [Xanthomonas sp. XNM01]